MVKLLNAHYPMRFDKTAFAREGGSASYIAYAGGEKYFLRKIKPAFVDAAMQGMDIQLFLQEQGFPVPNIILTRDGAAYVQEDSLYILYEYINGKVVSPARDAQAVGVLIGQLHQLMNDYPGELIRRDKHYYISKYVDILRGRNYPKAEQFAELGDALWARVKDLPRGACHGDLYRGNVLKTPEGKFYILDFDTFCDGVQLYDAALFCNMTDYFKFKQGGYAKTRRAFEQFLPAYLHCHALEQADFAALCGLIAVYHFALQATIIAIFGPDCVDDQFFDRQLDWLYRWEKGYK